MACVLHFGGLYDRGTATALFSRIKDAQLQTLLSSSTRRGRRKGRVATAWAVDRGRPPPLVHIYAAARGHRCRDREPVPPPWDRGLPPPLSRNRATPFTPAAFIVLPAGRSSFGPLFSFPPPNGNRWTTPRSIWAHWAPHPT